MGADNHPLDRSPYKRPSLALPGRGSRRWPVRRFDLELFLSAHARKHGQSQGVDQALENEQDNTPEGDAR
jgi:hypothetical protein